MTNFKPLKDKIWEAARAGDKQEFDHSCLELMKKSFEDTWRIGWEISPESIEDVYKYLENAADWAHKMWQKAMESGDAPPEDVSPGEGFLLAKMLIQQAIEGKTKGKDENGKVD